MPKSLLLILSSSNFIYSGLIFTSLIHFFSLFLHGIRKYSNLSLLEVAIPFLQHDLLKRLSLLHCQLLPPLLLTN